MNKLLTLLLLSVVPVLAVAAGDHHAGGHETHMHDVADMPGDQHASASGEAGDPAKVKRTIQMTLDDSMRFVPDKITVKAGETVRFFVKNQGRLAHELVLGSMAELKEHAEMMRKMPDMQHAEANMITLKPGQRGGLVWQFGEAGTVDFACLIPGHLEAGMVGKVAVTNN